MLELDQKSFDTTKHRLLKSDLFGTVSKEYSESFGWVTLRNVGASRPWAKWIAKYLAKREAKALSGLPIHSSIPQLLHWDGKLLIRSWIEGEPMQIAKPTNPDYFANGLKLLRFLHRHNVAHNDLAKETNWLVTPEGQPALVDFQLARVFKRRVRKQRNAWFQNSAREDIRYMLKHKRGYCPEDLTARETKIVSTPALTSRIWRKTGKPVYLFITRKIFNWQDREGAYDRNGTNK